MSRFAPDVARLIGELAEQGVTLFVPTGAEHMLTVEGGKLVIHSEMLSVTDVVSCIACGYEGPDLAHRCGPIVAGRN